MREFLIALEPYVTDPNFLALVSGVFAPFLHWFLRELGLKLSPRQNFWFNVFIAVTPFMAMATAWGAHGLPQASELFPQLFMAAGTAKLVYHALVKKWMDGRAEDVDLPNVASKPTAEA